jgi:hypothetical protein
MKSAYKPAISYREKPHQSIAVVRGPASAYTLTSNVDFTSMPLKAARKDTNGASQKAKAKE